MPVKAEEKPLYLHNRNDCIYLGSNKRRDYYFCKKPLDLNSGVLIIRLSNRPSDYFSMPLSVLTEALKLGEMDNDSAFGDCYFYYLKYKNFNF